MNNAHTLLVGQTGAGKTVLAKHLIARTARAIVHDMNMDYSDMAGLPHVYYESELDDAIELLLNRDFRFGRFVLIFQSYDNAEQMALLEFAEKMQETEPHGPLVNVIEESSYYSSTHDIDPTIERIYNMGRRLRMSLLTIIQVDTSIHRVTRFNSKWIVSVKQNKLSTDLQTIFEREEVRALQTPLPMAWNQQTPKQGVNFLVYPDTVELFPAWSAAHGYLYRATK